jgi:hypothetical protein
MLEGPQPHPNFIDLSCKPPFRNRDGQVARVGEDGQTTQPVELKSVDWRYPFPLAGARIFAL